MNSRADHSSFLNRENPEVTIEMGEGVKADGGLALNTEHRKAQTADGKTDSRKSPERVEPNQRHDDDANNEKAGAKVGSHKPDVPFNRSRSSRAETAPRHEGESVGVLSEKDIEKIVGILSEGRPPLASRADLIELHSRIVKMFATLTDGLSEVQARKAAEDRRSMMERIDELDKAINKIEGAIRIEMQPMITSELQDILKGSSPTKPTASSGRAVLLKVMAFSGLLAVSWAAGVWFQEESLALISWINSQFGNF